MRPCFWFILAALCFVANGHADSLPIQQWIREAIQSGGGTVTIPEGVHELTSPLIIEDAQKLAIRGMNKERCLLKLKAGTLGPPAPLISIKGTSRTLEISGLTLEGSSSTSILLWIASPDTQAALKDVTVRDCLFKDFEQGIQAQRVHSFSLERCSFSDGSRAVVLQDTPAAIARGNHIIRVTTAFDCIRAESGVFDGNELWNCDVGFSIHEPSQAEKPTVIRRNGFIQTRLGLAIPEGQELPLLENNENLVKGTR